MYHFECEVSLDNEMVIRMIEYDFHTALTHNLIVDKGETIRLKFPQSVIMYPGNAPMADEQKCIVVFPDGFQYAYKVPVVKIQNYSLEEIAEKNLLLFIPFTLMRFAPRATSKRNPLTEKELTAFIRQIIVILEEQVNQGRLTVTQFKDYTRLLEFSAERVFRQTPQHQEEVMTMIKSVLVLPSDEMEMTIEEKERIIAELDASLAEKDASLAEKDARIAELEALLAAK